MSRQPSIAKGAGRKATTGKLRLQEFLPYKLAVVARAISHELAARYAREFGISIPEWRIIAHLGEVERCSSGDICARTEMDKAKVNRAVVRLTAAGLVLASISEKDKRLNVLMLSAKGRAILKAIVPIAIGLQDQLAESLTEVEQASLFRIINKLQSAVSAIRDERVRSSELANKQVGRPAFQRWTKTRSVS